MKTDEISNDIKKSVLAKKSIETKLSQSIKEIIIDTVKDLAKNELRTTLKKELTQAIYIVALPNWLEGDKKAGELLGVSDAVMWARRNSGFYTEGVHWKKANSKIKGGKILWSKNALLKEREKL